MKKIRSYALGVILIFVVFLTPKLVNAQSISPSTIRVKSSDNSQVLADQSLDFFTNSPYYSTQIELPFSSPSLQYNTSYGLDMYVDFYVSYYNDWGNFGLNSPGVYILYNGLQGQTLNYNVFSNDLQNVSNVVGYYRLHLSGTFATNSQGTLYIALPFSHAIDLYGVKFVSAELNFYGSNTSNSDIIASNNQNTQNILTNNNGNTQQIINNNNQNTQQIIESSKACTKYDINQAKLNGYLNNQNGTVVSSSDYYVSDFIPISDTTITILQPGCTGTGCFNKFACFYTSSKEFISCIDTNQITTITNPTNAYYFRYTTNSNNVPVFSVCGNGNQALNNAINNLNDSISDKNIDNALDNGSEFFDSFQHDSHGLSGLITSPLRLLNALSTAQCSPLRFQLPFIHNQVELACPRTMYESYFGVFFSLWQLITTGLISYNICINIYHKIHMMQNPNSDRIEVLNL